MSDADRDSSMHGAEMIDVPSVPRELVTLIEMNFPQDLHSSIYSPRQQREINRNRARFVAEQIWRQAFFSGAAWQLARDDPRYLIVTQETYDAIKTRSEREGYPQDD